MRHLLDMIFFTAVFAVGAAALDNGLDTSWLVLDFVLLYFAGFMAGTMLHRFSKGRLRLTSASMPHRSLRSRGLSQAVLLTVIFIVQAAQLMRGGLTVPLLWQALALYFFTVGAGVFFATWQQARRAAALPH